MDISVIVPVHNEEKNLPVLHGQLRSVLGGLKRDHEIIYVNDGSSDNSLNILQGIKAADAGIRIISFDRNYGQTAALDAGLRHARGEFILTISCDLQESPEDLIKVFNELQDCDAVICRRIDRLKADGFIRYVSSRIANFVRNKVLHEDFADAGCFLRGFRKSCSEKLQLYQGFHVFIDSLLKMQGCRVKEIAVKSYPRKHGKSGYGVFNRLFSRLLALFVVRWMQKNRLRYKISGADDPEGKGV